jgi:hypothetical protein
MIYTQRTADWVIQKAYAYAEAKAVAPAVGTNKYTLLLTIVDSEQKDWADEPGTQWDSLYQPITLSAVVTDSNTVPIDMTVGDPSLYTDDFIVLTPTNGGAQVNYKLVRPDQLDQYQNDTAVAIEGRNLVFSQVFLSTDALIGASILMPNYGYVNDIVVGSDIIQVDNPNFLAYMCAAAFVLNDIVKAGNYNLHLNKAAQLMDKMKELNAGTYDQVVNDPFVQGQTWV